MVNHLGANFIGLANEDDPAAVLFPGVNLRAPAFFWLSQGEVFLLQVLIDLKFTMARGWSGCNLRPQRVRQWSSIPMSCGSSANI